MRSRGQGNSAIGLQREGDNVSVKVAGCSEIFEITVNGYMEGKRSLAGIVLLRDDERI